MSLRVCLPTDILDPFHSSQGCFSLLIALIPLFIHHSPLLLPSPFPILPYSPSCFYGLTRYGRSSSIGETHKSAEPSLGGVRPQYPGGGLGSHVLLMYM